MASPITITPTLKNESSAKFNKELESQKNNKVSQADRQRIFNLVEKVLESKKSKSSK
jgi:hypothetical protein